MSRGSCPKWDNVALWHFSDVLTPHDCFRFRMHCRRDLLVASLSAFDLQQTSGWERECALVERVGIDVDRTLVIVSTTDDGHRRQAQRRDMPYQLIALARPARL